MGGLEMRTIPFSPLLVALSTFSLALPGQRIWRVNCAGGPNVDYTDLPQAVAAASPGDTIYVYHDTPTCPGAMQGYTAPTIDKPLNIVGFNVTAATPGSGNTPTWAKLMGLLTIRNIAANERVSISNIDVTPIVAAPPPLQHGLLIENCDGPVLLEDFYYAAAGYVNSVVRIDNCRNVTMRGCLFLLSGVPLTFIDSTALLSTVRTGSPFDPFWSQPYNYTANAEALHMRNSDVTVIGSLIEGAPERNWYPVANWYATVGAVVESGTLRIGPATWLLGGRCSGAPCNADSYFLPHPSQAQVLYDSRAWPLYFNWTPMPYTPATIHATYHDWVVAGENYSVSVVGPPNGWGLLAVGSATVTPINIGIGMLAMDPFTAGVIGLRRLSGIGEAVWPMSCAVQAGVAHAFAFQAAVLDSSTGTISLTVPSPFTVGWPHGHAP
ncbi:MAG: hypothetical protein KDC98_25535 [Planctomycetes bacterium]|nr:hypothetical protein [Planctomycetota bacterium]